MFILVLYDRDHGRSPSRDVIKQSKSPEINGDR